MGLERREVDVVEDDHEGAARARPISGAVLRETRGLGGGTAEAAAGTLTASKLAIGLGDAVLQEREVGRGQVR